MFHKTYIILTYIIIIGLLWSTAGAGILTFSPRPARAAPQGPAGTPTSNQGDYAVRNLQAVSGWQGSNMNDCFVMLYWDEPQIWKKAFGIRIWQKRGESTGIDKGNKGVFLNFSRGYYAVGMDQDNFCNAVYTYHIDTIDTTNGDFDNIVASQRVRAEVKPEKVSAKGGATKYSPKNLVVKKIPNENGFFDLYAEWEPPEDKGVNHYRISSSSLAGGGKRIDPAARYYTFTNINSFPVSIKVDALYGEESNLSAPSGSVSIQVTGINLPGNTSVQAGGGAFASSGSYPVKNLIATVAKNSDGCMVSFAWELPTGLSDKKTTFYFKGYREGESDPVFVTDDATQLTGTDSSETLQCNQQYKYTIMTVRKDNSNIDTSSVSISVNTSKDTTSGGGSDTNPGSSGDSCGNMLNFATWTTCKIAQLFLGIAAQLMGWAIILLQNSLGISN